MASAKVPPPSEIPLRTPMDVGAYAGSVRAFLGMKQAELARKVGVSKKWISEFENGKPRVELHLVLRVLSALGIDLMGRIAAPPADASATRFPYVPNVDDIVDG